MSFHKPCHMPFRKLVPPFTLTGSISLIIFTTLTYLSLCAMCASCDVRCRYQEHFFLGLSCFRSGGAEWLPLGDSIGIGARTTCIFFSNAEVIFYDPGFLAKLKSCRFVTS